MKTKKVKEQSKYNFLSGPDWHVKDGLEPTRTFEKGELVVYGNHDNAEIDEVFLNHQYGVRAWGQRNSYGKMVEYEDFHVVNWYQLDKLNVSKPTSFTQPEKFFIRYSNTDLRELIGKVLEEYAGVDMEPEYQRDYVWEDKDKEALIDSIFNNVSIGHFVFCKNEFKTNSKAYEILDGKQRLSTLVAFFEDRFQYKGYYFSELSRRDKNHFEGFGVTFGTLEYPTLEQKYLAFISLNTSGKVMDKEHLANIQKRYTEMN